MIDRMLKVTNLRDAISTLKTAGVAEMISEADDGSNIITTANHHVAIKVFRDLLMVRGTYDAEGVELTPPVFGGPHLMVRLISDKAKARAKKLKNLAGFEVVANPGTVGWFT